LFNAFLPLPLLLAFLGPPPIREGFNDKQSDNNPYEQNVLVEIPGLEDIPDDN